MSLDRKDVLRDQLQRVQDRFRELTPLYEQFKDAEPLDHRVEELLELILTFDVTNPNPMHAAFIMGRALEMARELKRPREVVEEFARLKERSREIGEALEQEDAMPGAVADAEALGLVDGRPI